MKYEVFLATTQSVQEYVSQMSTGLVSKKSWLELTTEEELSQILTTIHTLLATESEIEVPLRFTKDYLSSLELLKSFEAFLGQQLILLKANRPSAQ